MQRAPDLAERAVQVDPEEAGGRTLTGHVRGFLNRHPGEALSRHERAAAANPNRPLTWCLFRLAPTDAGECRDGIRHIRYAHGLSPADPLDYFHELALDLSYLLCGDYESASMARRRAIDARPIRIFPRRRRSIRPRQSI
jgi:hypothetical protein